MRDQQRGSGGRRGADTEPVPTRSRHCLATPSAGPPTACRLGCSLLCSLVTFYTGAAWRQFPVVRPASGPTSGVRMVDWTLRWQEVCMYGEFLQYRIYQSKSVSSQLSIACRPPEPTVYTYDKSFEKYNIRLMPTDFSQPRMNTCLSTEQCNVIRDFMFYSLISKFVCLTFVCQQILLNNHVGLKCYII